MTVNYNFIDETETTEKIFFYILFYFMKEQQRQISRMDQGLGFFVRMESGFQTELLR